MAIREASSGKAFFFEKKKQKTSTCFGFGLSGWAQLRQSRVFWFPPGGRRLFFKKEPLSSFTRLPCAYSHSPGVT
jgi:hypothetical protein